MVVGERDVLRGLGNQALPATSLAVNGFLFFHPCEEELHVLLMPVVRA
jgi:hypothetical protein